MTWMVSTGTISSLNLPASCAAESRLDELSWMNSETCQTQQHASTPGLRASRDVRPLRPPKHRQSNLNPACNMQTARRNCRAPTCALSALACEATAAASCTSRGTLKRSATLSEVRPVGSGGMEGEGMAQGQGDLRLQIGGICQARVMRSSHSFQPCQQIPSVPSPMGVRHALASSFSSSCGWD